MKPNYLWMKFSDEFAQGSKIRNMEIEHFSESQNPDLALELGGQESTTQVDIEGPVETVIPKEEKLNILKDVHDVIIKRLSG